MLPIVVVLLMPGLAGWGPAIHLPVEPAKETSLAPEILAELSSDMNAIALAVIVGASVLLRERRGSSLSRDFWAGALLVVVTAVASCYAGFRFRFAVAEQILIVPLDLDMIGDRLAAQGALLLISISGLFYLALLTFAVGSGRTSSEPRSED